MRSSSSARTSSITSLTRAVRGYFPLRAHGCSQPSGLDIDQFHVGRSHDEPFDGGKHLLDLGEAASDHRDPDRRAALHWF